MKLISEVTVSVKKGMFPALINEIYKKGCEIQNIKLSENNSKDEIFTIEIIYHTRETFNEFITLLKDSPKKYSIVSMANSLEEKIKGGLLQVSGKMPLETQNDYEMNLLGSIALIREKINNGNGMPYTGISKNIGVIGGIKIEEDPRTDHLLSTYTNAEKDSIVINRFSNLNALPLIIKFSQREDIIKTIKRIEDTFSVIRLTHIDEADISFYDQLYSEIDTPVTSHELDDVPAYLLTIIVKLLLKNKIKLGNTTVGLLGVDLSGLKIARLLKKIGGSKMLGYDNNENLMFQFENEGGLATTAENIFSNADIILLFKNNFTSEEFEMIRPGQFMLSLLQKDAIDMETVSNRGIREFISVDLSNTALLFPGLLQGIISQGISTIDDKLLFNIARKLANTLSNKYAFPGIFDSIHEKIPSFFEENGSQGKQKKQSP
ncbi:MAG: hypothetical protein GY754_25290 [bacterium]|nr:hypothetical protein [bacterium]